MNKIAISIMTYNRHIAVRQHIEKIRDFVNNNDVAIYVFDGSSNDKTKAVVEKIISEKTIKDKLYYYSYSDSEKEKRHKDSMLLPEAEYIWISSDKLTWNPKVYKDVMAAVDKSYDVIAIGCEKEKNSKTKIVYKRSKEFFKNCCYDMTLMGATIIKKSVIENAVMQPRKVKDFSFWYLTTYFMGMADKKINAIKYIYEENYAKRGVTKEYASSWKQSIFSVWCKQWYEAVMAFPKVYDEHKSRVIIQQGKKTGYFTVLGLCILRGRDIYNLNVARQYKDCITRVMGIPYPILCAIAVVPNFIAKLIGNFNKEQYLAK